MTLGWALTLWPISMGLLAGLIIFVDWLRRHPAALLRLAGGVGLVIGIGIAAALWYFSPRLLAAAGALYVMYLLSRFIRLCDDVRAIRAKGRRAV